MRILLLVLSIGLLHGCTASSGYKVGVKNAESLTSSEIKEIHFSSNLSDKVAFRGDYDLDDLNSNHAPMLYPGGNGAVFLSSIIAHAAVTQIALEEKEQALINSSSKMLSAFQGSITAVNGPEILSRSLESVSREMGVAFQLVSTEAASEAQSDKVSIYSQSTFIVSEDLSQIRLQNAFFRLRADGKADFINVSEVHSKPIKHADREFFWKDSAAITATAEELFGQSVQLMLQDELGKLAHKAGSQKTVKYFFGGDRKFERGALIARNCKHTTLRTLRGWIKRVATPNADEGGVSCQETTVMTQ